MLLCFFMFALPCNKIYCAVHLEMYALFFLCAGSSVLVTFARSAPESAETGDDTPLDCASEDAAETAFFAKQWAVRLATTLWTHRCRSSCTAARALLPLSLLLVGLFSMCRQRRLPNPGGPSAWLPGCSQGGL